MAFCINCGHELPDGAKFCMECGEKIIDEKNSEEGSSSQKKLNVTRKKIYKGEEKIKDDNSSFSYALNTMNNLKRTKKGKIIIVGIALIIMISLFTMYVNYDPNVEKIDWNNVVLKSVIPVPKSNKMEIQSNTEEEFIAYVHNISQDDYYKYLESVKENKGFTIDIENSGSYFYAYNNDGYYLSLSYHDSSEEMWIVLEEPMELDEIELPGYAIQAGLPVPDSNMGHYLSKYDDHFYLYVGNMPKTAYKGYVKACTDAGFDKELYESEEHYWADTKEGHHVNVDYIGFNTVRIEFELSENSNLDGKVIVPGSNDSYWHTNYKKIIEDFETAGFTNVLSEPIYDISSDNLFSSEGKYEKIYINGSSSFSKGDRYPVDVEIVVTYHASTNIETDTDKEIIEEKDDEFNKKQIEPCFTQEAAKRAVIVALTNANEIDTIAEDGNSYDPKKFHSYDDLSCNYLSIEKEGQWEGLDENTWRVEGMVLTMFEYERALKIDADVLYDKKQYIVFNVKEIGGKLKYIDSDDPNKLSYNEYNLSEFNSFLYVSEDLIEKDR